MHRFLPPLLLLIAGAGAVSGCSRLDSYNRPYTWHPTGANAANIAAQVAHPSDLLVGRGTDQTDAAVLVPGIVGLEQGTASPAAGGGSSLGGSSMGGSGMGGGAGIGGSGGGN